LFVCLDGHEGCPYLFTVDGGRPDRKES
jgi:hypothetical protein